MSGLLLTVVGSLIAALVWAEFDAWAPRIAKKLVARAASRSPVAVRLRVHEEWLAHLDDTPGHVSKIVVAFGFNFAAARIALADNRARKPVKQRRRFLDVLVGSAAIFAVAPSLVLLGLVIYLEDRGPVLFRQRVRVAHGKSIYLYRFRTMYVSGGEDVGLTRSGAFLRQFQFDELPLLINLVRGHLSIDWNTMTPKRLLVFILTGIWK